VSMFRPAAVLIATGAIASIPAPASAQAPATTLTATGTAQAAPEPDNRRSEPSIRRAVEEAEASALPRAVADGRAHAAELAAAAGLTLGPLLSIADAPATAFPVYYPLGTFPNGRYCGRVRRTRTVVRNGVRRRVAAGTRRLCRVPPNVSVAIQLTYSVTPS
jgi:hypothetical protein